MITWQAGAIITLLLIILVAVAAQDVSDERRARRDYLAERKRTIARNGFKSRMGVK